MSPSIKAKVEHGETSQKRYHFACLPLVKFFGKTKVDRIQARDIEKYIVWRKNQTSRKTGKLISRETVNRELVIFKKIFRRLIDDRILRENPARNIKQLAGNDLSFHVVTAKEEKAYLMACPQPLRDIAALMLETGMRPDEVYRIRRNDVFIEKNYL
jgi:integrase